MVLWCTLILNVMTTDDYGNIILDEQDIFNLLLKGRSALSLNGALVDSSVNIESAIEFLEQVPNFIPYKDQDSIQSIETWDRIQQQTWHMPEHYQQLDIAQYVLDLCSSQEELQRVGEELLLYQERDLFSMLKYLKYLVDTMRENHVIWGVGRGSSVASHVLYLMGVHRINSMFYDLDPQEFLR